MYACIRCTFHVRVLNVLSQLPDLPERATLFRSTIHKILSYSVSAMLVLNSSLND